MCVRKQVDVEGDSISFKSAKLVIALDTKGPFLTSTTVKKKSL